MYKEVIIYEHPEDEVEEGETNPILATAMLLPDSDPFLESMLKQHYMIRDFDINRFKENYTLLIITDDCYGCYEQIAIQMDTLDQLVSIIKLIKNNERNICGIFNKGIQLKYNLLLQIEEIDGMIETFQMDI